MQVVSAGLPHQYSVRYFCIGRNLMKPQNTKASKFLYLRSVAGKVQAVGYTVLLEGYRVDELFTFKGSDLMAVFLQLAE